MYEPREDSFLMLKHIKSYAKGHVLDMGTGSGILAEEAGRYADNVVAADIDGKIIDGLKKRNSNNITFVNSDLFSNVRGKFNLIMFNPPYLPSRKIKHADLDGGKNGTQIIAKFLEQAKKYLKKDGKILILTSSLNKNIETLFKRYKYHFRKIDEERLFFEKLHVYVLF